MKSLFVLLVVVLLSATAFAGPVTVTPTGDATALAMKLIGDPDLGFVSASYTGSAVASGTFVGDSGTLPFSSGIVLTSGYATNAGGAVNTSDAITGDNGLDGSAMLNALIPGYSTYDATILTITFIPKANVISFQYVFGSDEYNEWVDSAYNDVFGFFLNGTAIANNIALIPGTNTPVSINNVNLGKNADYYTTNDPSEGAPPVTMEYDGFVGLKKVLYAQANVNPGVENIIHIAIADAGDHILDSGVFLKEGSFVNKPAVPEPGSMVALTLGLLGVGYAIRRRRAV